MIERLIPLGAMIDFTLVWYFLAMSPRLSPRRTTWVRVPLE